MIDTNGKFYLGKDPKDDQLVLYSPDDLTTHAVVVGMTGSGKTGLCIGLLEEAALQNIPAIMIDPKGDITNALLHFPDLLPSDFQPWVNPDEARRAGQTIEQAAEEVAGPQSAMSALGAEWTYVTPNRKRATGRNHSPEVLTSGTHFLGHRLGETHLYPRLSAP